MTPEERRCWETMRRIIRITAHTLNSYNSHVTSGDKGASALLVRVA